MSSTPNPRTSGASSAARRSAELSPRSAHTSHSHSSQAASSRRRSNRTGPLPAALACLALALAARAGSGAGQLSSHTLAQANQRPVAAQVEHQDTHEHRVRARAAPLDQPRNSSDELAAGWRATNTPTKLTCANTTESHAHSADHEAFYATSGYTQAQASDFVRPTFYTLRLKVDPTKRKFSGQLMIALDIEAPHDDADSSGAAGPEPTSGAHAHPPNATSARAPERGHRYVTLHAGANIHIKKAFYVFSARANIQIPATRLGRNASAELLTLDFHPNVITAGQGLLLLVYSGLVNDTDSHGLFVHRTASRRRSALVGVAPAADELTAGLATHMEPSFARRLFPAWDEPHLKARFSLIVVLPERGYECVSNMDLKRRSVLASCTGEPLAELEFHPTPPMSTYLLTLVVGRFEHIEASTATGCRVRAYFYADSTAAGGSSAGSGAGAAAATGNTSLATPHAAPRRGRRAAQLALELAVNTFDRLEALLGVKYPLAKFDMIALRDFHSGAMENWGAAIFHENYLLCDNASHSHIRVNGATQRPKRLVVPLVVAHEIAHQWFGNLVTARTWTYLWLNEGFAQLLMYDVAAALYPNEHYWHIFAEDNRASALREDELVTTSRPLEVELAAASAASEQLDLFDQLTYNKGAALVRMLELMLGRRHLLAGLQHYLLKHAYEPVTAHDLWRALEESTGRADGQLESTMWGWLRHDGYPLLSVRVADNGTHWLLDMAQERFTLLPARALLTRNESSPTPAEWADRTWTVPVAVASETRPEWPATEEPLLAPRRGGTPPAGFVLGAEARASLALPKSSTGHWFKLNAAALAHFRVHYEPPTQQASEQQHKQVHMLALLAEPVRSKRMRALDRLNLVDDLFALTMAAKVATSEYLRYVADAYATETEPVVLRSVLASLARIRAIMSNAGPEVGAALDAFVQRYARRVSGAARGAQEVSGERQAHSNQAREIEDLVGAARGLTNDSEFVRQAADLFSRHFEQRPRTPNNPLDGMEREMRAAVYGAALADEARDADAPLEPPLPAAQQAPGAAYVTKAPSLVGAHSRLSSIFVSAPHNARAGPATAGPAPAPVAVGPAQADPAPGEHQAISQLRSQASPLFVSLCVAYEGAESANERYAIASALGSVQSARSQLALLNLAVNYTYFRSQDVAPMLEAMARTKLGRHNIWALLCAHSKQFEARQLLEPALRALSPGLIDNADNQIETKLRALYQRHADGAKLIVQTLELVRINTLWHKRDTDELARYLESAVGGEPGVAAA